MASGIIYGTTSNENITCMLVWNSTPNLSNNTSAIVTTLFYKRTNTGDVISGTGSFSITIDGTKQSHSAPMSIGASDWCQAFTANKTVTHDSNGAKSVTISAEGSIPGTVLASTMCSGTAKLDTIGKSSIITSVNDTIIGEPTKVKFTPTDKSFRYKISFVLGSWNLTTSSFHPNQTSAYTYSVYLPLDDIAKQLPDSKTGTVTVTLYTYSNSSATTQVGSASSKTFTVTIPNNSDTKPSVSMDLALVSSLESPFSSLYIQGKTKVKATISATGKFNATIKSYSMTVGGKTYDSPPYESEYLTTAGTVAVKGRATDSRGNYADITENITVVPYSKPRIKAEAYRCDENGNPSDSGTYLKISAERSYSPMTLGGEQKNFCQIQYRYKAESGSYAPWTTLLASDSLDSDEVSTGALLDGTLSPQSTYIVQVQAIDVIGDESSTTITIPTENVYLHKAGSRGSLGFGEYAEEDDVISIAKNKRVRLKGSINDVRMYGKALSGESAFDIGTYFSDFTGSGSERQAFFVFGEASGKIVYGVAMVSNNGTTLWDGTTGVTLTTKSGGVLTVTLPAVANDIFTILSGRHFSV